MMPQFIAQADTSYLDDVVAGYLQAAEFTMDEKFSRKRIDGRQVNHDDTQETL
jgi:hypothetical protein